MTADADLIAEIAIAEQTLRGALAELADRLSEGRRGRASDGLMQHCREMAEILAAAVGQLGVGIEEDATRAAAAHLLAGLRELERSLNPISLH